MMQGIYVNDVRPASKAAIKRELAFRPDGDTVALEATSAFGNEYSGPLSAAPDGRYSFVGPDPYTSRKFYGTIVKSGGAIKLS